MRHLRARVDTALQGLPVQDVTWQLVRPGDGWLTSGIDLTPAQPVTILASGRLAGSRTFDVWLGPQSALRCRLGSGPAVSVGPQGATFTSHPGGAVDLVAAEPGVIDPADGSFDASVRRARLGGVFEVAVIRWFAEPGPALRECARRDPELFAALYLQHRDPVQPPVGWSYHPRLGTADIFTAYKTPQAGASEITCRTHADVGILRYPVDVELTADLRLSWTWKVDSLPSTIAEHTTATHDYLSLAAEFDDGRDLTWMWSSTLPVGYSFRCPLPWWKVRETHLVVRSGTSELGTWQHEDRAVLGDALTVGYPDAPQRVVAIWLIANSTLARGIGHCTYRNLRLSSPHTSTDIPIDVPTNASPT